MSDLRDWLASVECLGQLQRIAAPVDCDQELGAVNYLVASREGAPAPAEAAIPEAPAT